VTAYAFSFVFPYLVVLAAILLVASKLRFEVRDWRRKIAVLVAAGVIALLPPGWVPLARWVIGLNANFSVPLTALLLDWVWGRMTGTRLLGDRDRLAAGVFGLAAGVLLYPMALGIGGFDPYSLGWGFSPLFVLVFAVTAGLLYFGSRFGVVLVAAILAYDLGLLESPNLWDYVVDPFYVVTAGVLLYRSARARRREARATADAGAGG
jgi:hypothetical protein